MPEVPAHLFEGPPAWMMLTPPDPEPGWAPVPEMPAWMVADDAAQERWLSPADYARLVAAGGTPEVMDELDSPYRAPRAPVEDFASAWEQVQTSTARMWQAAAAVEAAAGERRGEFVGDDLALVMNTHPMTGRTLLATAVAMKQLPELLALVDSAELGVPHAQALLAEASTWAPGDLALQAELIRTTLERCQARVARGEGWPKPGELKKRLITVAFLHGLTATERRRKTVAENRGIAVFPTGVGAAGLSIEGPAVMVAQMHDAIRARAAALGTLPGDTRNEQQRLFDAAHDLLCIDADGGQSRVPALDDDGNPVIIWVRGVEISLVMPYSLATGGELELAELPGLGPVLPSTARELLAKAHRIRRIAVDADTGHVLAVDDAEPMPTDAEVEVTPRLQLEREGTDARDDADAEHGAGEEHDAGEEQGEDSAGVEAKPPDRVRLLLERLVAEPVVTRDLSSASYRVPKRLRRFVEHRDRTCVFPGCRLPGKYCDVDHREPWPLGPTSEQNCHCLCRRHHRAKQAYFTVSVDPETGDTIWTTPDGRQYRRPPPTY